MTDASHVHEHEDAVDGCICGLEFSQSDVISDADLPPAAGGMQTALEKPDNEEDIDGCDVDFNVNDATQDVELPVAAGGTLDTIDLRRA